MDKDEKGRFTEGNSGRPKGSKNKANAELKNKVAEFVNDSFVDIKKAFKRLDDADKVKLFIRLLDFVLAKPKETLGTDLDEEETTIGLNDFVDKL